MQDTSGCAYLSNLPEEQGFSFHITKERPAELSKGRSRLRFGFRERFVASVLAVLLILAVLEGTVHPSSSSLSNLAMVACAIGSAVIAFAVTWRVRGVGGIATYRLVMFLFVLGTFLVYAMAYHLTRYLVHGRAPDLQ